MQKWEYCRLSGVGTSVGHSYPYITFYTPEGEKREDLSGKDEIARVAKRISQLGLDGWEAINVVEGTSLTYSIYFKRPISN